MHDIDEELAMLGRLAQAYKEWLGNKSSISPGWREWLDRGFMRLHDFPEPPDVKALHDARADPFQAAIQSQLSVVGWRLYAKGGIELMTESYRHLEVERFQMFLFDVRSAWYELGFPGDPRGTWARP